MKTHHFALALLSLVAGATCLAQEKPPASVQLNSAATAAIAAPSADPWKTVRDQQPAGLHLSMTLPKTRFRIGEPIPAKLTFTNETGDPYFLWIGTYDRSGRIRDITIRATGEHGTPVDDPLDYYFQHYGFIGGGLGNHQNIGSWEITLPANQWLRLEKPGKYKLYAQSARVIRGDKDERRETPAPAIDLVSDPVEITLEALAAGEEKEIIEAAVRTLSELDPNRHDDETRNRASAALQRLRFLDSPASQEAFLQFLDSPYGGEAQLALFASKDYAVLASKMIMAVQEGRLGLSSYLVQVYAQLKTGGLIFEFTDPQPVKSAKPTPQEELYSAVKSGLRADGTGPVFFANLLTLFRADPKDPTIRAIVAQRQRDLPQKQIDEAFEQKGLLVDKDFLPLLRDLVSPEKHDADALAALAAIAPEEARPIILGDIRRPKPIYLSKTRWAIMEPRLFALKALPDQELPELDPLLRERLPGALNNLDDLETVMALVERYATKALLPDIKAILDQYEGRLACAVQANLLRYCLRCDRTEGLAALGRALKRNQQGDTGCYHTVVRDVLQKNWVDEALPLVLDATTNDDVQVLRSVADVLAAHAGPEVIDPLITAIEKLSARPLPPEPSNRNEQLYTPIEMTNRIIDNQRWKPTRAQLERLQKAAVDKNLQRRLTAMLEQNP